MLRERTMWTASAVPPTSAIRTSRSALRVRPASGATGPPTPRRGTTSTAAITRVAPAAGTAVSHSGWSGPASPRAMTVPSTATATKFTELLIRKNATERRAICSTGIPPSRRIHAPSARPPAPLAGVIGPRPPGAVGGDDRARAEPGEPDLPARAPRHALAEHRPEHEHVRGARQRLE